MKMEAIVVIAVFFAPIAIVGCREKDTAVQEIELDLREVMDRLAVPRPDAWMFGIALSAKVSRLDEVRQKEYRTKFEDIVFSAKFDAPDYDERFRQIGTFCDLTQSGPCDPPCSERYWIFRLRMLERLRQELLEVEKGKTPGNLSLECYVTKLNATLTHIIERFEKHFNEQSDGLTDAKRVTIRKEFTRIMGRPIRTSEEIAHDRQRLIDEARRRQEENRGNDVRVDIESL